MDIAPMTDAPPHVEIEMRTLPDLSIMWGHNSPHRMIVNHAPNRSEDVFTMSIFATPMQVRHPATELDLDSGTALIFSTNQAFQIDSPIGCQHMTLGMPRQALARVIRDPEQSPLKSVASDGEAMCLLKTYLRVLQGRRTLWAPDFERTVVRHIYDLVALALGTTQEIDEYSMRRSLGAARLAVAKKLVRENLQQRDLTINWIAASQNVTPRYLQMLFESEGTTFSAFVLAERLALVHRLLQDERLKDRSISDIALGAGFGDISYFNRVFRRVYGDSPSHMRRGEKP
jgi:AraC-like DNA-binding protein